MNFLAKNSATLDGEIRCPGDKSISQRIVMISSLINSDMKISGFLNGNDPISTANALIQVGAGIKISGTDVIIKKQDSIFKSSDQPIDLGNSGTGIRLLMGFLAGLNIKAILTGDESLIKRPMRRVTDPLTQMGADISTTDIGTPPVELNSGNIINDFLYKMPISSAQVKSSILLAALTSKKKVTVIENKITRDHTEKMIDYFGGDIQVETYKNGRKIILNPSELQPRQDYNVAGDFSSASFLIVAGLIAKSSNILIKNVGLNKSRSGLLNILKEMGANIKIHNQQESCNEKIGDIEVSSSNLNGIEIGGTIIPNIIDEIPILSIAAAAANGKTIIKDAKELRVKESDRLEAIAAGLGKLNVPFELYEDGIQISGVNELSPDDDEIDSYGDHRIAMSFLISSLISKKDIRVKNCENIYTSFPNFFELMGDIGLKMERYG